MPKLKLFISHSSRLDDIDHTHADDDCNWRLLRETCEAIQERYGDRVDVLVDKDGLIPGDDWEDRLNTWLAECHVAIILFSKRAIEKSNWVAKEAAILSWRRELDPNFILIPVLLDGETTPGDLSKDFFGTLKIDKSQCIKNAATAADILQGLEKKLGKPEDLAGRYPQTPLEILQEGFAQLLNKETTEASLEAALQALDLDLSDIAVDGPDTKACYAETLARHLFASCDCCCKHYQLGINPLIPSPRQERANELFKKIRPLWVNPGAAASIPAAREYKRPLALNGQFVTYSDPLLGTERYTLERYIERSWPASSLFRIVSVESTMNIVGVKEEIRRSVFGSMIPPGISEDRLDQAVNSDPNVIILCMNASEPDTGLPDPRLLDQLSQLHHAYQKLIVILDAGAEIPPLPDSISPIQPALERDTEQIAFLAERSTRIFLDHKYGIRR